MCVDFIFELIHMTQVYGFIVCSSSVNTDSESPVQLLCHHCLQLLQTIHLHVPPSSKLHGQVSVERLSSGIKVGACVSRNSELFSRFAISFLISMGIFFLFLFLWIISSLKLVHFLRITSKSTNISPQDFGYHTDFVPH